jgi:hypothetical protein
MEALAALLNLSGSVGVDADLEGSARWKRVAAPDIEGSVWPAQAHGCVFDAAADEWVPVRFPAQRRHRF